MEEVQSLREKLKTKFDEDMRLLDEAERMFARRGLISSPVPVARTKAKRKKRVPKDNTAQRGSVRRIVLGALSEWITMNALVELTQLKPSQVRGVLNANDLKERIDRQTVDGVLEFKVK